VQISEREGGHPKPVSCRRVVLYWLRRETEPGFSLIEVLIVVAIIATLTAIAVPNLLKAFERSQQKTALGDLNYLALKIAEYELHNGSLPDSLDQVPGCDIVDPWGNPYQYLRIRGADTPPKGKWRKDRFLVPINTDFDLYSMGPDGRSRPPLTAKHSRDDIIRAADGTFFGTAEEY